MTKELTEQWREGKLPDGSYYINLVGCVERVDFFDRIEWARTKDFRIEEVLAPVPAYNVWKNIYEQWKVAIPQIERLEKQLAIATKALNRICEICTLNKKQPLYIAQFTNRKVKVSLKEMEGVNENDEKR